MQTFVIPEDYQERILEAHRKLEKAYDDAEKRQAQLQNRLQRIKDLYKWEHIDREEYLKEHDDIQSELSALNAKDNGAETLDRLAHFLANVGDAWIEANREQRQKLSSILFEEVWIEHNRVVGVKPRPDFKPFFQLSYENHLKSSTCGLEPHRGRFFPKSRDSLSLIASKFKSKKGFISGCGLTHKPEAIPNLALMYLFCAGRGIGTLNVAVTEREAAAWYPLSQKKIVGFH